MKIRNGFVSNSSSSSFVIKNQTDEYKDLSDFARETKHLVKLFNEEYTWNNDTVDDFMKGLDFRHEEWKPFEARTIVFGDEDGDVMGKVYDYMLRDGGRTKSFSWYLDEMLR